MKAAEKQVPVITAKWFFLMIVFMLFSFREEGLPTIKNFPYRQAGLTERQAAAHLVSRFTYGATNEEIDQVVKMGLEKWFKQQLMATLPDDSLHRMIDTMDVSRLNNEQIDSLYPSHAKVNKMAVNDGIIRKDTLGTKQDYKSAIKQYRTDHGFKSEQQLFKQFFAQKILRAIYTKNQLNEVMTDFWFNHFNVSLDKNTCARFIPAYERDVIRPNALGRFNDLLLATAKSPAMAFYLDNFLSSVTDTANAFGMITHAKKRRAKGLNENYAREVMELHTLGVDGGYTQADVTQAAKVLTGWTVFPMNERRAQQFLDPNRWMKLSQRGFIHDGDFLFNADLHEKSEKIVLGHHFGPNKGYQEGVELLFILAHHSSTAHFISKEIATRFISDNPPKTIVDKMAQTFIASNGDIKAVLTTLVASPEFWSQTSIRAKIKSPFELAISTVRSLHANVTELNQIYYWAGRMGEKKYRYLAPTGFPDQARYWINTGSLLNRMNFGLAIAANRIRGLHIDLLSLNGNHEPESTQAALYTYTHILLPERDLTATIKRLTPLLNDPDLDKKVATASHSDTVGNLSDNTRNALPLKNNATMLAQVVGIIIGSPEYQRK